MWFICKQNWFQFGRYNWWSIYLHLEAWVLYQLIMILINRGLLKTKRLISFIQWTIRNVILLCIQLNRAMQSADYQWISYNQLITTYWQRSCLIKALLKTMHFCHFTYHFQFALAFQEKNLLIHLVQNKKDEKEYNTPDKYLHIYSHQVTTYKTVTRQNLFSAGN